MRKCAVASCRNKVEIPETYCEEHKDQSSKDYNKHVRYNQDNEKYSRFYATTQWKRVRKAVLMREPMCRQCALEGVMKEADLVHHVEEIRSPNGWDKRLSVDNLEPICYAHHNQEEHRYSWKTKGGR